MQSNNLIQVFSQAKNNYYNDTEIVTSGVQTIVSMGAVSGQYSNSALYNSFCLSMSLPVVALVDYIAQQNPSVTFGMALGIDQWISAVQGTFANYTDTQNSINAINTNIANITNGTTTVGNASNVTTNINGKAISTIFESDGTTVKNATNATTVQNVNFSSSTPSQFGNYIISKKQLIATPNSSTYTFDSDPAGNTYLINDLIKIPISTSNMIYYGNDLRIYPTLSTPGKLEFSYSTLGYESSNFTLTLALATIIADFEDGRVSIESEPINIKNIYKIIE